MPSTHRCVYGCLTTGVTIHKFPSPEKYPEMFRTWVSLAAEYLENMPDDAIYRNRSVCDIHFEEKFRNRYNRLNKLAIPTLHLPGNVSTNIINNQPCIETSIQSSTSETPQIATKVLTDINNDQPCVVTSVQTSMSETPQIKTKVLTVVNKNQPSLVTSVKSLTSEKPQFANKVFTVINKDQLRLVSSVQSRMAQTPQVKTKVTVQLTAINKIQPFIVKSVRSGITNTSPVIIKGLNPIKKDEPCIATSVKSSAPEIPEVENETLVHENVCDDNQEIGPSSDLDISYLDKVSTAINNDHAYFVPSPLQSSMSEKLRITNKRKFTTRERLTNFARMQEDMRRLKSEICRLRRKNENYRKRLREALQLSDDKALQRITENMSVPAKIFTNIQFRESMKKPKGRRFTDEEKVLARSLYNISPDCYSLLSKCFTLPSRKIMRHIDATE